MTDGVYGDIINFDSPNVRQIHIESAIDGSEISVKYKVLY